MPANDVSIIVGIQGNDAGAQRVKRNLDEIENKAESAQRRMGLLQKAILALGGFEAVRRLARLSDSFVTLETKLGNVTKSTAEYNKVFGQLFNIAQKNGDEIGGLVDVYARLNVSLTDSVRESTDLVKVTELLSRGLAASGANSQVANAVITQLSQGLAGNFEAAAQELNSLIEGAPLLASIIAKELGLKSAAQLKRFAQDGELTAETFLKALINAEEAIKAFELPPTIGRSLTRLQNAFGVAIGQSEALRSAATLVAQSLDFLAENAEAALKVLGAIAALAAPSVFLAIAGAIRSATVAMLAFNVATRANLLFMLVSLLSGAVTAFMSFRESILDSFPVLAKLYDYIGSGISLFKRFWSALTNDGKPASAFMETASSAQAYVQGNKLFDATASSAQAYAQGKKLFDAVGLGRKTGVRGEPPAVPPLPPAVPPSGKTKSKTKSKSDRVTGMSTGRRVGVGDNSAFVPFSELTSPPDFASNFKKQFEEMRESARMTFADIGTDVAKIFGAGGTLSVGIGDAVAQSIVFGESFAQSIRKVGQEIISSIISALVQVGVNMLLNATLGKKLLAQSTAESTAAAATTATAWAPAAAVTSLGSFGSNAVAAMAGIAGVLALTKGFKDGGYTGGGGINDVAGVVHGQEFVVNASATKENRALLERMNAGKSPIMGGGGAVYNIDARGADAGVVERIEKSLERINSGFERRAIYAVADARKRDPNLFGGRS